MVGVEHTPMPADYFLYIDQQYGPYDMATLGDCLRQGTLTKDTWVFRQGEASDWTRAEEVPSLKGLFQASPVRAALPSSSPLAAKLKQATLSGGHSEDSELGTMLVSPSSAAGIRAIQSELPKAPLSDIPQEPALSSESNSAPVRRNWLQKIKGFFRRSP